MTVEPFKAQKKVIATNLNDMGNTFFQTTTFRRLTTIGLLAEKKTSHSLGGGWSQDLDQKHI